MENLLEIKGLKTQFFTRNGVVPSVDGVDITIPKGTTVGIVGESGCGKSVTALSVMRLLQRPGKIVDGQILFNGEDLVNFNNKEYFNIRGNKISMIFQEPMTSLNPVKKVGNQVQEVIKIHQKISKEEAKQKVIDIFRKVDIPEPERRYNAYPHELSGGLRQRVMIAMAMVCNPQLMIADEPTTALDVTIERQILNLMRQLQKDQGTSIMMITHNLGVVAELCEYVYVMYAGKVMEYATVKELFKNPLHPYTKGLLGSMPKITLNKERLNAIPGVVPNLLNLPKGCRFCPRCSNAMNICDQFPPELREVSKGHFVRCFLYDEECSQIRGGEKI